MGTKLLWTGIVFMLAIPAFLGLVGLTASPVIPAVGAVIMVIGLVVLWLDK